ncbi:hypothetical protein LCGC14_0964370 [marine sediment metagenome]|uniref:Transcription elongation factor GreA/GreB N-terminal domain-containing protein n=1 Tax=marine sediment metagenome TaxID=412755 RepID=A0A0F9QWP5_9ZZZZ
MQEPDMIKEEIAYGLGRQIEALRLEIRAASRRRGGDDGDGNYYEIRADSAAAQAESALGKPIRSSEARRD